MSDDEKILEKAKSLKAHDLFLIDRHEEAIELYKSIKIPPHDEIDRLIREDIDRLNTGNYKYGHKIVEKILFELRSLEADKNKLLSVYLEGVKLTDFNRIRKYFSKEITEKLLLIKVKNFIEKSDYLNARELLDQLEEPSRTAMYKKWSEELFEKRKEIKNFIMMAFLEKARDHDLTLKYARYFCKTKIRENYEDAYTCYALLHKIKEGNLFILIKDEIISLNLSLIETQDKLKNAEEYTEGCMKMISLNLGKENYPAKILIALGKLAIREAKLKSEGYEKALLFFKLSKDWEELRNVARYIMNELPKDCESMADKYYFESAKLIRKP
jgi:hypothetical protein